MTNKEIQKRLERLRQIAEAITTDASHAALMAHVGLLGAIQGWFIALEADKPLAVEDTFAYSYKLPDGETRWQLGVLAFTILDCERIDLPVTVIVTERRVS